MYARVFAKDYQQRRASLLGLPVGTSELEVHRYTLQGIPHNHLAELVREGEIDDVICLQITQTGRLWVLLASLLITKNPKAEARLSPSESDRFVRVVHVLAVAESVFGSREKARHWLTKPMARFSGSSPIELISTTPGTYLVEELLAQAADGLVL